MILDEASSPGPQLIVPDLNSPPRPIEVEIDKKYSPT